MKKQLSKSDVKKLGEDLPVFIYKKDRLEIEKDETDLLLVNGEFAFFKDKAGWVPLLEFAQKHNVLKSVVVDEGAVKFMANGADVMRPGIVEIEPGVKSGENVLIVDIKNRVGLAIGKAIFSGEDIMRMKSGKVITNMHHVGDRLWKRTHADI